MKTNNKYLDLYELMNEKLLKQEQKVISCLALLLSMKNELRFKDEEKEENRLSDDAISRITDSQAVLYPLLDSIHEDNVLEEVLLSSGLFTPNLANDILDIYHYREENRNSRLPLFDYSFPDSETLKENTVLFLQRMVAISRMRCYLEEIITGIEEYGVECYLADEESDEADMLSEKTGVFSAPDDMKSKACIEELLIEMMPNDGDSDEERDDKMKILSLMGQLGKYGGKSK